MRFILKQLVAVFMFTNISAAANEVNNAPDLRRSSEDYERADGSLYVRMKPGRKKIEEESPRPDFSLEAGTLKSRTLRKTEEDYGLFRKGRIHEIETSGKVNGLQEAGGAATGSGSALTGGDKVLAAKIGAKFEDEVCDVAPKISPSQDGWLQNLEKLEKSNVKSALIGHALLGHSHESEVKTFARKISNIYGCRNFSEQIDCRLFDLAERDPAAFIDQLENSKLWIHQSQYAERMKIAADKQKDANDHKDRSAAQEAWSEAGQLLTQCKDAVSARGPMMASEDISGEVPRRAPPTPSRLFNFGNSAR